MGLTIGWEASSTSPSGRSSNNGNISASEPRPRFRALDGDWEADFCFKRTDNGEVEVEVAGGVRKSEGIEHIRDSFLSEWVGRFCIGWVKRHCLCQAVWHVSRGQKCIVNDSGDSRTESGLYGCWQSEQTSLGEKGWRGCLKARAMRRPIEWTYGNLSDLGTKRVTIEEGSWADEGRFKVTIVVLNNVGFI